LKLIPTGTLLYEQVFGCKLVRAKIYCLLLQQNSYVKQVEGRIALHVAEDSIMGMVPLSPRANHLFLPSVGSKVSYYSGSQESWGMIRAVTTLVVVGTEFLLMPERG
jgi:hypothetical protein